MIFNMNYEQYYNLPYENLITKSINADGSVCGLIDGHRYNSSDTLVEGSTYQCSGFIPYTCGEVLHFKNIDFGSGNDGAVYLRFYDENFSFTLGQLTPHKITTQNNHAVDISDNIYEHFYLTYNNLGDIKTIRFYIPQERSSVPKVKWCRISWVKRPNMKGEPMIWKTPQEWDLDKRRQILFSKSQKIDTTGISILDQLNTTGYIDRLQQQGAYTGNTATTLTNITTNGFTISTPANYYGIGVPYFLKKGQTLSLTATVSGNNNIYISGIWYDLEGKWQVSLIQSSINNTTTSQNWTAKEDRYLVLIFAPQTADVEVTISNIQLEIM